MGYEGVVEGAPPVDIPLWLPVPMVIAGLGRVVVDGF
jgi:hypothetical protein